MKATSQKQQIILLLLEGWTDPISAFKHAGTIKLSTRVGELREHFNILHREKVSKSKFGKRVRYYEYKIVKDKFVKNSLIKYGLK
jgi:hypothetical protein